MITLTTEELINYYKSLPRESQTPEISTYLTHHAHEFHQLVISTLEITSTDSHSSSSSPSQPNHAEFAIDLNTIEIDEDALIETAGVACMYSVHDIPTQDFLDQQRIHRREFLAEIAERGISLTRPLAEEIKPKEYISKPMNY